MGKSIIVFICLFILSMGTIKAKDSTALPDKKFNAYKQRFVLALWKVYPAWASSVGYHKYDNVLVVPDDRSRANELAFCTAHLDSLKKFRLDELSDGNKTDYYLIENQLQSAIWGLSKEKAYQWNPSIYNVCG